MGVFFSHNFFLSLSAAVPILLLIYLLFRLAKPIVVSTLLLWESHTSKTPRGWSLRKTPMPPTFWVEAMILILLAVAAAGPRITRKTESAAVLILDDSYSMRASADDAPSARTAGERKIRELRESRPNSRFNFILSGSKPANLGVLTENDLKTMFDHWICDAPSADLSAAIALGRELAGQAGRIFVITDHPPKNTEFPLRNVEWLAFGHPAANAAVVNILRSPKLWEGEKILAFVANFSDNASTFNVDLRLSDAKTKPFKTKVVEALRQKTARIAFSLPKNAGKAVVSIRHDGLKFDDALSALPEIHRPLRIALKIPNANLRKLMVKALKTRNVVFTDIASSAELIICERRAKESKNIPQLLFPSSKGDRFTVAGPYSIDHSNPLTNGLNLKNIIWTLFSGISLSGRPLALAGDKALISIDDFQAGDAPVVAVNFIPKGSTLQRTANWPILFCNLVDWAIAKRPGLQRRNLKCGEEVVFTLPKHAKSLTLINPYGEKREIAGDFREIILPSAHPGIYSVYADGEKFKYVVRAVNPDESDLSNLSTCSFLDKSASESFDKGFIDLSWIAILAALALLLIHGRMIAARKTG
ncbi:MAG: VWA domain-containing protein [Victivallales bacterium]|nr:VWA domain-containing protein [Victivallales bacterium]